MTPRSSPATGLALSPRWPWQWSMGPISPGRLSLPPSGRSLPEACVEARERAIDQATTPQSLIKNFAGAAGFGPSSERLRSAKRNWNRRRRQPDACANRQRRHLAGWTGNSKSTASACAWSRSGAGHAPAAPGSPPGSLASFLHLFDGIHHGGVILPSEGFTDARQTQPCLDAKTSPPDEPG